MLKSIYKITNKLNGKCYIGQTNNIQSRFSDHKRMGSAEEEQNKILYKAFKKYGVENFTFEVIEENIENYNEREKYWIAYYNSETPCGYNMTPGGEEPPVKYGENHQLATHTKKQVDEIKRMLLETNIPIAQIAEQFNYDRGSINRINSGVIWHDQSINYPLRPESSKEAMKKRALMIINDLQNTDLTQKEIGAKYGLGRSTITAINRGQNYKQDDIEYPIRDKKRNRQSKSILMIDIHTNEVLKEFDSIVDAAIYLGDKSKRGAIGLCANGTTKSSHGYKWKYKE